MIFRTFVLVRDGAGGLSPQSSGRYSRGGAADHGRGEGAALQDLPDLPFLFGRVNPPPERYPARGIVNAAQEKIAEDLAFTYLVDTEGVSKLDDDLHYDTEGQQALGLRFADIYLNRQRR